MTRSNFLLVAALCAFACASTEASAQWRGPHGPFAYRLPFVYGAGFYARPWLYGGPIFPPPYAVVPPPYLQPRYFVAPAPSPQPVAIAEGQRRYEELHLQAALAPHIERTVLSAEELFGFDEAKLRGPQPKLDRIAATMLRESAIEQVQITGHTDRLGSASYNQKLSQRRAEAVKGYLVAKGVKADRLTTAGRGMQDPVVQCNDAKMGDLIRCLEPNRRVEVEEIVIERHVPQG